MASAEELKTIKLKEEGTTPRAPRVAKPVVADTIPIGTIAPLDLRLWNGEPLYVRNNTNELISYDDGVRSLTLRGVNSGQHISVLEIDIARAPGVQKMWRAGKISVSTDPATEDELYAADLAEDEEREAKVAQQQQEFLGGTVYNNDIPIYDYVGKEVFSTKAPVVDGRWNV